jgi:hypothetical protein
MFEAWILVCLAPTMQQCFPAQDTYGPYKEEQVCIERAQEMQQQVIDNIPMHIPVAYQCIIPQGEGV